MGVVAFGKIAANDSEMALPRIASRDFCGKRNMATN